MRSLKFLAICVGVAVDIGTSLLLGLLFGIALMILRTAQGVPMQEVESHITAEVHHAPALLLASMGLGAFGSLLGGFVTGWIAKHHRVVNGVAMGILSTLLGMFFWGNDPIWYNVLGVVCTIGPATSGAYIAQLVFGLNPPPPAPPIIIHP